MRGIVGLVMAALVASGAMVAGAGASPTTTPSIAYVTAGSRGLPSVWVAGPSGASPRRLGGGTGPLLSPSGETVAASDLGSSGAALTLFPTSAGARAGYFDIAQVSATALAWSPDSRYLAVGLTGGSLPSLAGYGLAIIDTQTGTAKTVATGVIYGASFAPGASDTLVYARASSLSATARSNLYTVAPDGSATKEITTDGRSADPVWGARGIAFDRERLRKHYGPLAQIWLMQPNGTGRRQITHTRVGLLAEGLVPLAFSADGTRLAAEFEGEDTSVGYSVSILTGRTTQLTVGRKSVEAWGISGDGRSVLISVGDFERPPSRGTIEKIPFSGGHPSTLIAHGDYPSWNL